MPNGLPFQLEHYLELVGWIGRHLDPRKRGSISEKAPLYSNAWVHHQNTGCISVVILNTALMAWLDQQRLYDQAREMLGTRHQQLPTLPFCDTLQIPTSFHCLHSFQILPKTLIFESEA
ncbi:hypothetical protein ACJJIE_09755 [Microbulbifer sp. TRSA001]|uniref:hypothetical protein n=1 Tax=Microbulbifer sp. TRSA001 TaxID=3243381 RepID=UPI00403A0210